MKSNNMHCPTSLSLFSPSWPEYPQSIIFAGPLMLLKSFTHQLKFEVTFLLYFIIRFETDILSFYWICKLSRNERSNTQRLSDSIKGRHLSPLYSNRILAAKSSYANGHVEQSKGKEGLHDALEILHCPIVCYYLWVGREGRKDWTMKTSETVLSKVRRGNKMKEKKSSVEM